MTPWYARRERWHLKIVIINEVKRRRGVRGSKDIVAIRKL